MMEATVMNSTKNIPIAMSHILNILEMANVMVETTTLRNVDMTVAIVLHSTQNIQIAMLIILN